MYPVFKLLKGLFVRKVDFLISFPAYQILTHWDCRTGLATTIYK